VNVVSVDVFAVTETDQSSSFAAGSNGYQANVPSTSLNLLANPGTTFSASQAPFTDFSASLNYATLIDGSFGTVPNPGGGGSGEVPIGSNTSLIYNFNQVSGFNLSEIDIFSGWGDGGRFIPTVTVSYTTTANPSVWIPLQTVNYTTASGNSTFVSLTNLGIGAGVNSIQFNFGNQQNGYVGYTELAVQGTQAALTGDVWVGGPGSDWGAGGNWQGGTAPAPGDMINFGATGSIGTVDLGSSGRTVAGLTFQSNVSTTVGSTANNVLTFDNGAAAVVVGAAGTHTISAPITLNSDAIFNLTAGTHLTVAGQISDGTAGKNLTAVGTGTLLLIGLNHYSGITTIQNGVLNVATLSDYGQDSSIGNRPIGGDGGGNVGILFRGGTLQYTGSTPQSTNRAIRINANGGDGFSGGATIDASGSVPSATLSFTATSSPDFFEQGGTRTLTLTGSNTGNNVFAMQIQEVAGSTNVVKSGAGTWDLTSTTSTYGGVTIFAGGILNVASLADYGQSSSLGSRGSDGGAGNVSMLFQGGTLQYTGSTPQSTNRAIRINADGGDGFTGGATIDASGSVPSATLSFTATSSPDFFEEAGTRTLTLTGSNTGNNTFGLAIVETGGATTVTKTGVGTWVLSGNSTYTGATNVTQGTLVVTGSLNGTTSIPVAVGATLAGTGTVTTGGSGINVSGTLTPGLPGVGGTLTLAGGGLSFNPGSVLSLTLGPANITSGVGTDTGTIAFSTPGDYLTGNGLATLSLSGAINYADTYLVFQNVTTFGFEFSQITGYDTANFQAQITQVGANYDLSFLPVPEPSSVVLLAAGLAGLSFRPWRRRCAFCERG